MSAPKVVSALPLVIALAGASGTCLFSQQAPLNWTAAEDHQNMMDQLGIKALRPGPSGNESAPNHANYDESTANPFPILPAVLTLKNGKKVTTAAMWWNQRRPEIVEDFDREVLGRVPANVPKVTWTVTDVVSGFVGSHPHVAVGKKLVGHVDNSSYPLIDVEIQMTLVTPADAKGPVPVMMMFGSGAGLPSPSGWRDGPFPPPSAMEQLIADGWGYASINPTSIQADNGAGLTKGTSVWLIRARLASRTTGARYARGLGEHPAHWIISKPIKPWMRNGWGLKVSRVTGKQLW